MMMESSQSKDPICKPMPSEGGKLGLQLFKRLFLMKMMMVMVVSKLTVQDPICKPMPSEGGHWG